MDGTPEPRTPPVLRWRRYCGDEDYWRVRAFLRATFLLNGRREHNWHVYRWDYWRWHVNANSAHLPLEECVFLWETADGQIAAVLNPEDPGQAFLQVHPDHRTPGLEDEMLALAEQYLGAPGPAGRRRLRVWAHQHDTLRQEHLAKAGYTRSPWSECQRRQALAMPLPAVRVPAGYTVRSLRDDELPARSWVTWRAFHPDEREERYAGWTWYHNIQRAPLYRRDLDLVAVAPDGTLAAFCTVWFDDVTRSGAFEPVGTAPAHQRRGVGTAVLREGLRRLQGLGATLALVASSAPAAHALYAAAGFTEYEVVEQWSKDWEGV